MFTKLFVKLQEGKHFGQTSGNGTETFLFFISVISMAFTVYLSFDCDSLHSTSTQLAIYHFIPHTFFLKYVVPRVCSVYKIEQLL